MCEKGCHVKNKKQFIFLSVMVIVAGFIGGMASSVLFSPERAAAQKILSTTILEAEGFHLIDKNGAVRGTFALSEDDQPRINFLDKDNKFRMSCSLGSTTVKNERSGENEILPPSTFSMMKTGKPFFRRQRNHGGCGIKKGNCSRNQGVRALGLQ